MTETDEQSQESDFSSQVHGQHTLPWAYEEEELRAKSVGKAAGLVARRQCQNGTRARGPYPQGRAYCDPLQWAPPLVSSASEDRVWDGGTDISHPNRNSFVLTVSLVSRC